MGTFSYYFYLVFFAVHNMSSLHVHAVLVLIVTTYWPLTFPMKQRNTRIYVGFVLYLNVFIFHHFLPKFTTNFLSVCFFLPTTKHSHSYTSFSVQRLKFNVLCFNVFLILFCWFGTQVIIIFTHFHILKLVLCSLLEINWSWFVEK